MAVENLLPYKLLHLVGIGYGSTTYSDFVGFRLWIKLKLSNIHNVTVKFLLKKYLVAGLSTGLLSHNGP